jgi:hypothetical protein
MLQVRLLQCRAARSSKSSSRSFHILSKFKLALLIDDRGAPLGCFRYSTSFLNPASQLPQPEQPLRPENIQDSQTHFLSDFGFYYGFTVTQTSVSSHLPTSLAFTQCQELTLRQGSTSLWRQDSLPVLPILPIFKSLYA